VMYNEENNKNKCFPEQKSFIGGTLLGVYFDVIYSGVILMNMLCSSL